MLYTNPVLFNSFHATVSFYTPWKYQKTRSFLREYRKEPVAWNELIKYPLLWTQFPYISAN